MDKETDILEGEEKFMKIIAIITARGGSKRIPHKNTREFCGKPIIAYAIDTALKSKIFDEIMVSTDDENIAHLSIEYGAQVPFMRSEKNSNDFATTEDVLKEVIEQYQIQGKDFDIYCCLYPTAPFISPKRLRDAMNIFIQSGANFLTPVVKYSYPPQRSLIIKDGLLNMQWPEFKKARSQDLDNWYHDCGQFYIGNTKALIKDGMSNGATVPFVLPETEVQDIDTEEDWKMAEMKYRILNNNEKEEDI